MKRIQSIGLVGSLVFAQLMSATVTQAEIIQWYVGGGLHRVTAQQWRTASRANRLATSADFVVTAMGESKVRKITGGNINRLKPYAVEMLTCLDEASAGSDPANVRIQGIAAACAVLLGFN